MFRTLFKRSQVVDRYVSSPLFEERLQYLAHWAKQGARNETLEIIARCQLALVGLLDLGSRQNHGLTVKEVEAAADRRPKNRLKSRSGYSSQNTTTFIRHGVGWLRFMGRLQVPAIHPHPFASEIAAFADYMRDERGLAPATIERRCSEVGRLLSEVGGQDLTLDQLTVGHLDSLLIQRVKAHTYSRKTAQLQADSLRALFRFAEQRGWCRPGLALAMNAPRIYREETLPYGPSWEDVQRFLADTERKPPTEIRNRAVVLLLAVYGFRVGEVCRLRLDDLDWEKDTLIVSRSKRGPIQTFPLVKEVGTAVIRYLREVRPSSTACRELFLTLSAPIRPLSRIAINHLVTRRWQRLNVSLAHYGPHSLRHACASRLINQGLSLKQIGDQLGHRDLNATRIYAKVDLTRLREVADLNIGGLL